MMRVEGDGMNEMERLENDLLGWDGDARQHIGEKTATGISDGRELLIDDDNCLTPDNRDHNSKWAY